MFPLNGTIYTTTRSVAIEKPMPTIGGTMADELGASWADSNIVSVQTVPQKGQDVLTISHVRIPITAVQDQSNFAFTQGQELIRTYLVRREKYFARTVAQAALASPIVADEFTIPAVGALDTRFAQYGFADDTLAEAPSGMNGSYVVIQRRFIVPTTIDYQYNELLGKTIRITKTIVAKETQPDAPTAGKICEIQAGNAFHDVKITQEIMLGSGDSYPYELAALPITQNFNFPSKLQSVDLVAAWAWAHSEEAAQSYSEDYYFKFKITDPRPGPYDGTRRRFVTNDPEAIRALYPITIVPQPVRESIAVVASWFYASDKGNSTTATAKEWAIPPTIHNEIAINFGGQYDTRKSAGFITNTLSATPNVSAFLSQTTAIIDFQVNQLPLGLFEVSVITINISGLYS